MKDKIETHPDNEILENMKCIKNKLKKNRKYVLVREL